MPIMEGRLLWRMSILSHDLFADSFNNSLNAINNLIILCLLFCYCLSFTFIVNIYSQANNKVQSMAGTSTWEFDHQFQ